MLAPSSKAAATPAAMTSPTIVTFLVADQVQSQMPNTASMPGMPGMRFCEYNVRDLDQLCYCSETTINL